MEDNSKKYWKGIEELSNDPEFTKHAHNEFPDFLSLKQLSGNEDDNGGTGRRDFLKLLGFGVAAVSLAACEAPLKRVIPYVNKPEEVDPGIANYYASTYQKDGEYCSIVVKTREGRPIKIEGNSLSPITRGGTSARTQASVLSLYDSSKLRNFTHQGKKISHEVADSQIRSALTAVSNSGGKIRIVSTTILSPSTKSVISDFKARFPTTDHIQYDPNSVSGLLKANQQSFGQAIIPSYDFSKANVIVSFGADFLGTWISPVEYAKQYSANKKLGRSKKTILRHYQIESNLSLTGASADHRLPIKPSQEGLFVAALYNKIGGGGLSVPAVNHELLDKIARDLVANKGKSIVISGSNDVNVQILVNEINRTLGNYSGGTININLPSYQRQGDDAAIYNFVQEAKRGDIGAVVFYEANPVYDLPNGNELPEALKKVSLKISFADRAEETASLCDYICPDLHFLESWNDAMPKAGHLSITQPTISPLFKETRSAQESLLIWSGRKQEYYTYLQNYWRANFITGEFQQTWDKAIQDGIYQVNNESPSATDFSGSADLSSISTALGTNYKAEGAGLELKVYEKVGMGSGCQANNPWLQELPDPISKATWDNYLAIPQKLAISKEIKQGDLVKLTVNGVPAGKALPVIIQPGQANDTVSVAIGYGRTKAGKCADNIGLNAYPFITFANGTFQYYSPNVSFVKTGERTEIAQTQTHHTIMSRPIIQDATLDEYQKNPYAGRFMPLIHTFEGHQRPEEITAWSGEHNKPNHLWGMVIDLNSCIGCGACVIGCQSENNIPVVGKKEVVNRREMHWIRIDRYYSSNAETPERKEGKYFQRDDNASYKDLEMPAENPQVTFQPMMCQHCNHAPCETVCPVAATTHSSEGLNQMAYNRCIGTRYCANNCPYKVRRFNWFKYHDNDKFPDNVSMNDLLGRMVLNPDVTVRSRGVMEKCTLCVQRIQEGKLQAKKEKRRVVDGEVNTACSAACPTDAIVFGDMNDTQSMITQQLRDDNKERAFHVLEEINTQPNISYLTRIRNINKA